MKRNKIKLYAVDKEGSTIDRLSELFYNNPQLGIKLIGSSHNFNQCYNDLSRAKEADVFLISAFLPDKMGIELIGPIKKVNPEAKIIIMLNSKTNNLAEEALKKGADEHLSKPYKAKELLDTIYELTGFNPEEAKGEAEESSENQNRKKFKIEPKMEPRAQHEEPDYEAEEEEEEAEPIEEIDRSPLPDKKSKKERKQAKSYSSNERSLLDMYAKGTSLHTEIYDDNEFKGTKPNIVAVFSSPTSAGKTTLAVNAAVTIRKHSEYKPKVCIVDFNLLFPSILHKFHQDDLIFCKRNVFDICEDPNNIDETLIKQALITHEPSGVQILHTPSDIIRDMSRVNPDTIKRLVTHLREMFDLIIIDTSSNIREDWSSFPLTIADKGFVVLEPDLSNLLHTHKFISMMRVFENNLTEKITSKFQYILNKESQKVDIHPDTIKRTIFNTNIRLTIPEDPKVTNLSNNGQLPVEDNGPSARPMKELARLVYPFDRELYLSKNKKKEKNILTSFFKKDQ
ncbi:response regulator (plasmid) [Pontibacillus sp. ALD_SL1]|uniref:response regulator n=1 Tax=Pontibacillus sp. ALD_SL1 TaxID=2777185 RepID=UPI001A97C77A|nr:response regulator [Pontibacillus sp. ALD_SL1]QST02981.1 response regulator [Pontibacillus sp. ALD_SL1]